MKTFGYPKDLSPPVKLPALPRGASVAKPSGTPPKPPAVAKLWRGKPVFALTGYAAVACRHFIGPKPPAKADPPRAATRGILAKASEYVTWISATRLDRPGQGQGDGKISQVLNSMISVAYYSSYHMFGWGCDMSEE